MSTNESSSNLDDFDQLDSENTSDTDSSDHQYHASLDIIAQKSSKINENVLIEITKEGSRRIGCEAKRNCKILKFSFEINFHEVYSTLDTLKQEEFPNLFIFIIEAENVGFCRVRKSERAVENIKLNKKNKKVKKIKNILLKFGEDRLIILQLKSKDENITKFYYKEENSNQFLGIDKNQKNFVSFQNFPTFLCSFMDGKFEMMDLEEAVINKLPHIANSSLVLRFLSIFELSERFIIKLILKCAAQGSKSDLLAALDAQFADCGRTLSSESQSYLTDVIYQFQLEGSVQSEADEQSESDDDTSSSQSIQNSSDESTTEDSSSEASNASTYSHLNPSVLHAAVEHGNKEVIDYLISHCTHLIQQLPFKHQVRISTTALESNQLDVLCDLLELSDFPFPPNFETNSVDHQKIRRIAESRTKLEFSIVAENFEEISNFIDSNFSLRIVYNTSNKSALKQAVDSKKYNVYYHLKSLGFQSPEFNDLVEILDAEELKDAIKQRLLQRRKNVDEALSENQLSINLLCNRSFIHNRKISKEQEAEYRKKIRNWYEDINKIEFGRELLNVAASCENLKIIFDFEDESVERMSLAGANALGSMYPSSKWIFVGAKLSDKKREQQIKGVLAHELCHYVMKLVFENSENPYYKHLTEIAKIFEAISKAIDKWSAEGSENPDDECNGIISSVFRQYASKDFHPELIVRVVQILAEFDEDEKKSEYIQNKYRELFEYFRTHILPEMQKFNLKSRENVRKINRIFELLPDISNRKIEFVESKDIKEIMSNKITIVTVNAARLFLNNIHNYLNEVRGDLFDTQNVFFDPERLENREIFKELKQLLEENQNLNIFIDCSRNTFEDFKIITGNKTSNFIFVTSTANQSRLLSQNLMKSKLDPINVELNYKWADLTEESKSLLLQTKVNFQNNFKFSILEFFGNDVNSEEPSNNNLDAEHKIDYFSEIVDGQLLNYLAEELIISINSTNMKETNFELLFKSRKFIKKPMQQNSESEYIKQSVKTDILKSEELLSQTKKMKYILISDIAGNGKSWVMKNFTNELRELNPMKWVTYVDLKQFVKEFKAQKSEEEFSIFIAEKILKPEQKFEEKMFKKLYENGKVIILFDGFDEIAPDCAEFVSDLATSFKSNEGNQLWIATRDYFEVDLQQKLQINVAFKLDEFTEEDATDFIAKSWSLEDLRETKVMKTKNDFDNYLNKSSKFKDYKKIANQMIKKISMTNFQSVGMPQLFKMFADGFKDEKDAGLDLKEFKIFEKFVEKLYERWSRDKGEIRKEANTKSLQLSFNFWKFHQFSAIKSLFPIFIEIFFPGYDGSEWTDEEIIACGLMSKKGGEFYFLHETFREFFVADFIGKYLRNLKIGKIAKTTKIVKKILGKKDVEDHIIDIFVDILTIKKYGVLRVFLNDAIDLKTLEKFDGSMQKFRNRFSELIKVFHTFFTQNLDNLVDFAIKMLKKGNYEEVKKILHANAFVILRYTNNQKIFLKFLNVLLDFLKVEDLKDFVVRKRVFQELLGSNLDVFEEFVSKTQKITGSEFIEAKLFSRFVQQQNILYYLFEVSNIDEQKIQKCLQSIHKISTNDQMLEVMDNWNDFGGNVLIFYVFRENTRRLKIAWTEIENFLISQNLSQKFKELVLQKDDLDIDAVFVSNGLEYVERKINKGRNILHFSADCESFQFHEVFWELLLKTFVNREELKNLVLLPDKNGENFIHELVRGQKGSEIIMLVVEAIKENFSEAQFEEILESRNPKGRNLLQISFTREKNSKFFQVVYFIWKNFRDFYKSDEEFIKILNEVDLEGNNVLHTAAQESLGDAFEFLMEQLEAITLREEIRSLLRSLNKFNLNLLQSAVRNKLYDYPEIHEMLWKMYQKYFESSEILEFITHVNKDGYNLLFCAARWDTQEVVDFIWNKIKNFTDDKQQIQFLIAKEWKNKNLLEISFENEDNPEVHKFVRNLRHSYGIIESVDISVEFIQKIEDCFSTGNAENLKLLWIEAENSKLNIKEILIDKYFLEGNILHYCAPYDGKEVHETLWKLLFETFGDKEELMNLIFDIDKDGDNFIYKIVKMNKNMDIIELTFKIFKENFNDAQFKKIFSSKSGPADINSFQLVLKHRELNEYLQFCSIFDELNKK